MRSWYFHIELSEEAKPKTAFVPIHKYTKINWYVRNHAKHITSLFLGVHITYISKSFPSLMHTIYQEANKYIKSITLIVNTANIHLITVKVSNTIFTTIGKSTITLP